MSEEQLKAFIAKDHGHEFTTDKIIMLSEEELEGLSGGGDIPAWALETF